MKDRIYKKPFPGLVAFTVAFLSQWLGHSAWTFIRTVFGEYQELASIGIGGIGAVLIWQGLQRSEVPATWMGFVGGLLVWVGWFEFTFEFYAEMFHIPQYMSPTGLEVFGGATVLMATLPIFLTLFLLYGYYNRQTKCNLLRWFHRNTGVTPGMPTQDNGRSFGRVVAMETLFVTWACYLFWLYVGYLLNNTLIMVCYVAWLAWTIYIFVRLLKIPRVGHAVRYGIPVGIVGWGVAEMPAHFGLYSEIWLKPFDYPLTSVIMLTIFVAGVVYVALPASHPRVATSATV